MNEVSRDASEMCVEQAYGIACQFCYFQWDSCNKSPVSVKQLCWTSQSMLWEWKNRARVTLLHPELQAGKLLLIAQWLFSSIFCLYQRKNVFALFHVLTCTGCTRNLCVFQLSLTGSLGKNGLEKSVWLILVRESASVLPLAVSSAAWGSCHAVMSYKKSFLLTALTLSNTRN